MGRTAVTLIAAGSAVMGASIQNIGLVLWQGELRSRESSTHI